MAGLPALNLAISVLKLRVHGVSGSDLSPETQYPNCFSLAGGGGGWGMGGGGGGFLGF